MKIGPNGAHAQLNAMAKTQKAEPERVKTKRQVSSMTLHNAQDVLIHLVSNGVIGLNGLLAPLLENEFAN